MLLLYVAEAWNINSVGTIAQGSAIFIAGNRADGAAGHHVVHQVAAHFSAGVGETIGKFRRGGFRSRRADSRVEAHKKTTRARNSIVSLVCPSMTRTPAISLFCGSRTRLCTTLKGRTVTFPVAMAAGKVELTC